MDLHCIPADSPPLWWRHPAQALDPECPDVRPEKNPQIFLCSMVISIYIYIYAEYDGVINQLQPPHITGWCYINTAADATNALGCSLAIFSYRGTVTNTQKSPAKAPRIVATNPLLGAIRKLSSAVAAPRRLEACQPSLVMFWLVVWTPLKNISQLGWLFPIYGKIKFMFQTTNQCLLLWLDLPAQFLYANSRLKTGAGTMLISGPMVKPKPRIWIFLVLCSWCIPKDL